MVLFLPPSDASLDDVRPEVPQRNGGTFELAREANPTQTGIFAS